MSTAVNPVPGQQITGNEQQDLQQIIAREVERLYAEQATKLNTQQANVTQQQAAQPGPIKLNVFGQEISFDDTTKASQAIEQALSQVRDAAFTSAQALSQANQGTTGTMPTTVTFDREKFANMVGEDPLKGLDYALGHLLFEGKVEGAASILKEQLGASARQRQELAAYQFREKYPNFQVTPQTVQALDTIRQHLSLPADSAESWEAAYATGVARGIFQVPVARQPQQQEQFQNTNLPQNPYESIGYTPGQFAPPMLGRSNAAPLAPDLAQKAESLSVEQLEQLIQTLATPGR